MNSMQKTMVEIGNIHDLPLQTGRVVKVNGREIAVFRISSGDVRAVENRCPHKNGPLAEGIVAGEYVFCPLHDRKINLNDGNVQAPDSGCVTTYRVDVTDEKVYISI